jgi:hypothetical protein
MVSPLGQPGCSLVRLTSLSRDGGSVARGTAGERAWQRPTRAGGRTRLGGNEPTILARRRAVRRPDRRLADLQRDERGDLVAERGRIHVGPVPVITPRSCIRSRCACTVSRATPRRREASGARWPRARRTAARSARRQYGRPKPSRSVTPGENPPGNTWRIRHFASCFRHCRIASWTRERPAGPGYSSPATPAPRTASTA